MAQWDTLVNIVNDAAVELGLYSTDIADPYASSDPNVLQLLRLLKSVGRTLKQEHRWSQFQKTHSFSTVDGTPTYALPADYAQFIDSSGWNRTTQLPLGGPLSAQAWEELQALSTSLTTYKYIRVWQGQIQLFATPTAAETIAIAYRSSYWVQPSGQTAPTAESPSAKDDTLWFDPQLLTRALKLAFLRAKGMDSGAAQEDYDIALAAAKGGDGLAPMLSLAGPRGDQRLLSGANVPDTGYGT